MGKIKKDTVFILDFDGVLFDTSLESFYVMNETHCEGSMSKETIINQKSYSKFIELRPFVTSAWQYYWVNEYTDLDRDESNYEHYSTEKIFEYSQLSVAFLDSKIESISILLSIKESALYSVPFEEVILTVSERKFLKRV